MERRRCCGGAPLPPGEVARRAGEGSKIATISNPHPALRADLSRRERGLALGVGCGLGVGQAERPLDGFEIDQLDVTAVPQLRSV